MSSEDVYICKASAPLGSEPEPDTHIHISETLPDSLAMRTTARRFRADAVALEIALYGSLPGGTYNRLLLEMLSRKASHLRVAHAYLEERDAEMG